MKVAIVGSRTYTDLALVGRFIANMDKSHTIVSGGALGVDEKAVYQARIIGIRTIICLPDLKPCRTSLDYTLAYHARNQRIVDQSDLVVAFTEKKTGGTWDTIKRARRKGIPVHIIPPFTEFLPQI